MDDINTNVRIRGLDNRIQIDRGRERGHTQRDRDREGEREKRTHRDR